MKSRKHQQNKARSGKAHKLYGSFGKSGTRRPAWVRDGYDSYMHYLADVKRIAMLQAVGMKDHPYHGIAVMAKKEGLLG